MHRIVAFMISLFLCLSVSAAQAGQNAALVIGNGAYREVTALPNPPSDARAMAAALRRMGYQVVEGVDLTLPQMLDALKRFQPLAERADIAVIFYAGHGMQINGQNFLLPVDARLEHELDLQRQALALDEIMTRVPDSRVLRLVILDACRDNPFVARLAQAGGTRSAKMGAGLSVVDGEGRNTLISYSTKAGLVAEDGSGSNSPFTQALLRHIETPGLEVGRLFGQVRDDVIRTTKERQQPFTYGSVGGDAIYLVPPKAQPVAVTVAAAEAAGPAAGGTALELSFWETIKNSNNAADFQAYIERFPNGTFAGLARNRLESLGGGRGGAGAGVAARGGQSLQANAATPPTAIFQDCPYCPSMVVVPPGSFMMGSVIGEAGREPDEEQHRVDIRQPFAIGQFEVTFQEWDQCRAEGGCNGYAPPDQGWGRGRKPVINVSWLDAQAYIAWLNGKLGLTGRPDRFRLPTEAEWEYAARSGGRDFNPALTTPMNVNYKTDNKDTFRGQTVIVGSLPANDLRLHEMQGNAREWVEDCYGSYAIAPADGSAATNSNCKERVRRGGSWSNSITGVRPANRAKDQPKDRGNDLGFRLARSLVP